MINIQELKEKSDQWVLEHIEKFQMLLQFFLDKPDKFKMLYIIHLLEVEYNSRQRISNEND